MKIDKRPKRGGWAPGEYCGKCADCDQDFIGDKRAQICADCAYTDPENDVMLVVEPLEVVRIRAKCHCGGEMESTGVTLTSFPAQYPHICKCGNRETFNKVYPSIEYVKKT